MPTCPHALESTEHPQLPCQDVPSHAQRMAEVVALGAVKVREERVAYTDGGMRKDKAGQEQGGRGAIVLECVAPLVDAID